MKRDADVNWPVRDTRALTTDDETNELVAALRSGNLPLGAAFSGAYLPYTELRGADMYGADLYLTDAEGHHIRLSGANLHGARMPE